MHYIMHINFTCSHNSTYNIYSKSYTKSHSKLAGEGRDLWITLEELLPPSPNILEALALFRLLAGLLLRLLVGLLLPLVLLLLPSIIDITNQCGMVLLRLLKFFLVEANLFSNL
jgi:hypothetical protein